MTTRAVAVLGIGQCVNWGVLYYAFAVLVLPLERELDAPTWVVTGAFSLALLVSAALAPAVGRLADRGHAPRIMNAGGLAAAALLASSAVSTGTVLLYLLWAGLGVCMAATLYEPAFAIVARAEEDARKRLRALAVVTLFGGLASTAFLPLTAFLVDTAGWRAAVVVLAVVLVISTLFTRAVVFPSLAGPSGAPSGPPPHALPSRLAAGATRAASGDATHFRFAAAVFSLATFASAALTANLVPALAERGVPATTAAMLGGVYGLMQLPGRALMMNGTGSSPARLVSLSLILMGGGLSGIAFAWSDLSVAVAIMVFGVGAGLTTLVRPHLVHTMFRIEEAGHLNGRIARQQQLARAAGPIAVAWLAGLASYGAVFMAIAGAFLAVAGAGYVVFGSGARLATSPPAGPAA